MKKLIFVILLILGLSAKPSYADSGFGGPKLNVESADAAVSLYADKMIFPTGNVSDDGAGTATITLSSMVYPDAGIPLSTGSAWGTSITNNSANWNTAYGWGNHASGGYLTVEVDGSITNEINTITLPDANVTAGLGITFTQAGAIAITESVADTILFTVTETDPIVGAITGIVKANGAGTISAASAGTDYIAPYGSTTAKYVLAAPNASDGTPSFRLLVASDIPALAYLTSANIDTFAELDTIVADKSLVNKADGAVWLGTHDFGGAVLELPNGTSGTTDATGETYLDTNGDGGTNFSGEVVQIYTGAANKYLFPMALPLAASQDNFIPTYDAVTKTVSWEVGGTGTGDITSVGDCVTGACFDGTQGTTLTFYDAGGNQTLKYNESGDVDFNFSNDININDITPHLRLTDTSASEDDFEMYADASMWYLTNVTDSVVLAKANSNRFQHNAVQTKTIVITNPTSAADGPVWRTPNAITILAVHVLCTGGTNIVGQLYEYDNNGANGATVDSSDITGLAGVNVNDDGTLSNPSIDAGDYVGWNTTSVSGSPTRVAITYDYQEVVN